MSPINPLCRSGNSEVSQIALSRHSLPEYPALRQTEKNQGELTCEESVEDCGRNESGSRGLVVRGNKCLLCALRFSKYRIEGSCAYVIRRYPCIPASGNVTQFPDAPNARKMEPGNAFASNLSADFPSVHCRGVSAKLLRRRAFPRSTPIPGAIIDGNNRFYRACQSDRLRTDSTMASFIFVGALVRIGRQKRKSNAILDRRRGNDKVSRWPRITRGIYYSLPLELR